ncbi:MAG: Ankyrin [Bryobacterales bacterium]|nr:Ankyrin [Bryobacterales bacterium]
MHRAVLCLFTLAAFAAPNPSDDFYSAIRTNDLTRLRALMSNKADINIKDRHGATPLMYAAAVGSVDAVRALLAAGADVKAKNAFDATALMWGITNPEKVRFLVDAGADVNARSKQGRTPLLIAASNAGSIDTIRLLVSKGADAKPPSEFLASTSGLPSRRPGSAALLAAATAGDLEMVRFFIENGGDVNGTDQSGNTPLQAAAAAGNLPIVKLLLAKGAKVDTALTEAGKVRKGPVALNHLTALMFAAPFGRPELLRALIDAGANVNARDIRDMTPLMLAVSSETQNAEVVRLLLEKGADAKVKSALGETALDWARKFGDPAVLRLLGDAIKEPERVPEGPLTTASPVDAGASLGKSITMLQRSSTEFFKESGCVGCHHQNLTATAVAAARKKGVPVDDAATEEQLKVVTTQWMGAQEALLQRLDPPGAPDTQMFSLLGLAALDYPADAVTDALVLNIAAEQMADGSWCLGGVSRSPIEEGCIARATRGIRLLQLYGPPAIKSDFEKRIVRARDYLLEAQPKTTDDRAMLLLGLKWSGASSERVGAAARTLLSEQRADGGWAGNRYLASDAYATGEALDALFQSGKLASNDAAYRRGVDFLFRTQRPDGSWYVKSRAVKFQPYFESGFPHGHDQWISVSGTAVAVIAIANGMPDQEKRAAK